MRGGTLSATAYPGPTTVKPLHPPRAEDAGSVARRADRAAVGRAEAVAVAIAAIATFGLYAWAGQYWVDLADEGYFLYLASRVHAGDLPYRDFDTYYTPGVFYLYAAVFELFGVSIAPVRVLMAATRVVCGLLLYGLTRRVARWPFAVLPFLAVAAVDPIPVFPEPHPAWWGLVATLLTLGAIVRHRDDGRLRWVALAGAAAGLAFFFKQNVGAFAALAVGGYLILRDRGPVGHLVLTLRAVFVLALALVATGFLWSGLGPLLAVTLWLPLLATLALLLRRSWGGARAIGRAAGLRSILAESILAGAAFVGVTLLWLVPLTLALGPRETPFGLFVGAVNQGALLLPLEPPPRAAHGVALAAIWLPLALAHLWPARRRPDGSASPSWRVVLLAAVATLLVPWIPTVAGPHEPLTEDPSFFPWLDWLDTHLNTLYLYLPALGAWAALGALLLADRRRQDRDAADLAADLLPWYVLAGTLANLAMYPRSDTLHAMFAGPPLFVVGAWALARIHRTLVGGAGRARQVAVFAALLVVPTAAVAPHAYWRYVALVHADPRSPTPPPYVPVGLERAPVLAPQNFADSIRGAVEFVRAGTPPGEPFLAYPVVPMFHFLADRPNPTRFDHFLPGALTEQDVADVIDRLETTRPRYVLWDHGGVVYWDIHPTNLPISDYIWRCYEQVANFPPFLILERRAC